MARSVTFLLLVVMSLLGLAWSECGVPVFKEGAAEMVKTAFKESRRRTDFTKIEVDATPFNLVENGACVNGDEMILQYNNDGGEEWTAVDVKPKLIGGGKYKFTVEDVVPCKDHYFKILLQGEGGSAQLSLPNPVAAASNEDLVSARYRPSEITGINSETGSDGVTISWNPAECAVSYEITYKPSGSEEEPKLVQVSATEGNSVILTEGLEPCTDYKYEIFAVIGDEYEGDEGYFSTAPDQDSASKLTPTIKQFVDKLEVTWKAYDKLSCVPKYQVEVCKVGGECGEKQTIETPKNLPNIVFTTDTLEQCSDYTINITPLYESLGLDPISLEKRTLSPKLEAVAENLKPVTASELGAQIIKVSWSAVQCAEKYVLYQKQEVPGIESDWEEVGHTGPEEISKEQAGVPCTAYRYGVKVVLDGVPSEIVEIDEAITTKLDISMPFVAPNLELDPAATSVQLTWDHGACIPGYKVVVCREEEDVMDQQCVQEEFIFDSSTHNISETIGGLEPCSPHNVKIYPKEYEMESSETKFNTDSPAATPPEEYNVYLDEDKKTVHLNWTYVKCATGYKIQQELTENQIETSWETPDVDLLSTSLQDQEPCITYRYGIAAVVGGETSEPTDWTEISIPPRNGEKNVPQLEILLRNTVNDTLTLMVNSDGDNNNCPIEAYHLKYNGNDKEFSAEETVDGEIVLEFEGASGVEDVEACIKYKGFDELSPCANTWKAQKQTGEGSSTDMLVPIVIGVLVAVVIIVVLIFFFVKKRKTNQKYDAVQQTNGLENGTEETEKLNDDPAV